MAERRMISRNVIMDDRFLDLPAKSRALYLCLLISADDDGFIGGPKSIMRQAGASPKDLTLLESGDFLYLFSSGVAVVRHWFNQNTIRKDRYTPTQFQHERALLRIDDHGVYQMAADGCQNGDQPLPQNRIGKDRLDQKEEKEENEANSSAGRKDAPAVPISSQEDGFVQKVFSAYTSMCSALLPCTSLDSGRIRAVEKLRQKGWTLDTITNVFAQGAASSFLQGKNERGWKAGFDWLIQHENLTKVKEGAYDDRPTSAVSYGATGLGAAELAAISRVLRE